MLAFIFNAKITNIKTSFLKIVDKYFFIIIFKSYAIYLNNSCFYWYFFLNLTNLSLVDIAILILITRINFFTITN